MESGRKEIVYELVGEMAPGAVPGLDSGTSLVADLGYDSLDLLELVTAVEECFDLAPLREDTVGSIDCVGDLLRLVDASAEAPHPGANR